MASLRRSLPLLVLLAGTVTGCASNPPEQHFPPMTFGNEPVFSVDVAKIDVVSQFKSPGMHPHIEYEVPLAPENALRRWAIDRLKAVGHSGTLRVIINNASVVETPLPYDKGFVANFKEQLVAQAEVSVDVTLQILDDRQFVVQDLNVTKSRLQTEHDGMKLSERDQLLYDLVVQTIQEFDKNIDSSIHENFNNRLVQQ